MLFAYLDQKVTSVINFFKSLEAKIVSVSQLSTEVLSLVQTINANVDGLSTSIADEKVQIEGILTQLETLSAINADNEEATAILSTVKEDLSNIGTRLALASESIKELIPDPIAPPVDEELLIDPPVVDA